MKKIVILSVILIGVISANVADAYWIWTPESGKWMNPKYAVKDTPKEQYDWAMNFFEAKDYKRGISEFQKLVNSYPRSEYAPRSQYYIGLCHEELGNYYEAFLAYQQVMDKYPYTEKTDEIIEREFRIGNLFLGGQKDKILGVPIMPSMEKAIEIYQKVASNAPYGQYADKAQYQLGLTFKKLERYDEAVLAFKKFSDQYPKSDLLEQVKYELAYCLSRASGRPGYDQRFTDEAIEVFEGVAKQTGQGSDIDKSLAGLKEKKARSDFDTGKFYERQKQYKSALIYYQGIVDRYPQTTVAVKAAEKVKELKNKVKR